jgi:hypothetical protein
LQRTVGASAHAQEPPLACSRYGCTTLEEDDMDFGKGALLWLLGVPLPVILLIALFWHH